MFRDGVMISLFEPVMGLAISLNDLCYLFNTGLSDAQTNLQPKITSRRLSEEFSTFTLFIWTTF